ncbi:ROK family transcriptional regulator [Alkalibacter saccharofermentans]|uniref:Sugar kinase of the NBD/HSP70 family, may contain an N-terminal HTH domain n=1 Tax=Alkalibacter saccharofermentans DSM 14828 TaxID=1120975 RepID=A0A1M4U5N0_9FIRM|nr:ROK family transcriptional regulator [Alkalibacter saccharofermentans]SHE51847.1 Sugar kinase of the NBD/HSP70 family, may contain an N-terminal HTH domain [Alkalibacter saccharofermentans DSM 14828]
MLKLENKGKSQTKSRNKIKVFNYIWEKESVSRTDISKELKISAPSVTRIVNSLIKDKFIKEVGSIKTSVGRSPVKLEVNKNARYIIGISITKSKIHIVLTNLGREILYKETEKLNISKEEDLLRTIESKVDNLLADAKVDSKKILGIGVATTGVVDFDNGIIEVWPPDKSIKNIMVKQYLESKYKIFVRVDNNINVLLFGEYWFKDHLNGERVEDLVCVFCGEGVGSSILINGQIIRGYNNNAGEIAHMKIEQNGKLCTCGQNGCLEAYISIPSMENDYNRLTLKADSFEEICLKANQDDKIAKKILHEALSKLAIAISNINVLINPEMLIVSGDIFEYFEEAMEYLKSEAEKNNFNVKLNELKWSKKPRREFMIEFNATALIYEEILKID